MRERPPVLRALGKAQPPQSVTVDGMTFRRAEIYKHDSWAATARYRAADGEIVCKFNRTQPVVCIPMRWLGRWLAARERAAYARLGDLDGVAAACGAVYVDGQLVSNAVAHRYVPGNPMRPGDTVEDAFFLQLKSLLLQIHSAGFAYVDLHKRENILIGDDGRPYLIDFQVSYQLPQGIAGRLMPARWLLRMFQATDMFCLFKHVRHYRPEQIAELGLDRYQQIPWWIRLHRLIAVPFRQARRRLLSKLSIRDSSGKASSEAFTEHALRN